MEYRRYNKRISFEKNKQMPILNNYIMIGGITNGEICEPNILNPNDIDKADFINQMIKILGFSNINDTKKIKNDIFTKNIDKLISNKEMANNKLNLLSKINLRTVKSFLGSINSIFSQYGFKIKTEITGNIKYRKKNYFIDISII